MAPIRQTAVLTILALLSGACGGARPRSTSAAPDRACAVLATPAAPAESAVVAMTWGVDPANALLTPNPGERFVFGHAYETLIRVDCLGHPMPWLASSWTPVERTTRWRFVLRDDARFWDGAPVTAGDVIASWRATGNDPGAVLARRLGESATVVDERTVEVTLCGGIGDQKTGNRSCPPLAALGSAELAVIRRGTQPRWSEGTGAYRIREPEPRVPPTGLAARTTLLLGPAGGVGPRLTVFSVAAADARDAIDAGVDLLLTDDPALSAYAAARGGLAPVPLGWDRTWVLMVPPRGAPGDDARATPAADSSAPRDNLMARTTAFRSALARDAVRADARASDGPYWWSDAASCGALPTARRDPPSSRASARVVYRRDEPVARAIAERLVALAGIGTAGARDSSLALLAPALARVGSRATAVGLAPNEFALALRAGSELGFVTALPRRSLAPCAAVERLAASAPWLAAGGRPLGSSSPDLASTAAPLSMVPLIDTRLLVVARRDRLGLTMTWDSTVTIAGPAPSFGGVRP